MRSMENATEKTPKANTNSEIGNSSRNMRDLHLLRKTNDSFNPGWLDLRIVKKTRNTHDKQGSAVVT